MPARMNRSCYSRILGRTYSAPDIIERILDGRPPFGLPQLLRDFPSSERGSGRSLPGAITQRCRWIPHSQAQAARMARFSGEARWGRAECVFSQSMPVITSPPWRQVSAKSANLR
jgi:hypothetical protein